MPRLTPLDLDANPDLADAFGGVQAVLGFIPNSTLTMARRPDLLAAFQQLAAVSMGPGTVPGDLKALVGHVCSRSAGCRYCSAHTAHIANLRDVPRDKIAALWEYETSPLFTDAERAALVVAQGAGAVPNAVTDEDFAELRRHFDDGQVVEIIGVIALYGFLNRWNDTMATELETSVTALGAADVAQPA